MAIFNVKHGLFRNIPEDIIPGTFLICEDENALYADLADEEDPDNTYRVRIGDFQIFDSIEDLRLNSNKSPHALYYVKPKKNSYGIETGNVLARYDAEKNNFYQINTDTGATSVSIEQLSSSTGLGYNLLTDVQYNPDTRKITLILGARASTQDDFSSLKSIVDRLDANVTVVNSVKYQINQEKIRAEAAEQAAQSAADHAQSDIDNLKSGEFSDAKEDIQTLLGSDKSESNHAIKSIRTIANEELTERLIPESAKEALDTLAEIAAWIQSHPDDAAAMNTEIQNLKSYVGNIPSSAYSTDIVNYISEHADKTSDTFRGTATIASESNGVVIIKGGVKEVKGVISNDTLSDITLAKSATTGKAEDISLNNGKSVEQQFEDVTELVQSWGQF